MENLCVPSTRTIKITKIEGRKRANFRRDPGAAIRSVYGKAARLHPFADEGDGTCETGAGTEDLCHSLRFQGSNIMSGNSPAQHHQNVGSVALLEQSQDAGNDHVMRTGE